MHFNICVYVKKKVERMYIYIYTHISIAVTDTEALKAKRPRQYCRASCWITPWEQCLQSNTKQLIAMLSCAMCTTLTENEKITGGICHIDTEIEWWHLPYFSTRNSTIPDVTQFQTQSLTKEIGKTPFGSNSNQPIKI